MPSAEFDPVIKWTGSKRLVADRIASLLPSEATYYEPFVGGGSVLYATNPAEAIAGDRCEPLVDLWREIRDNPDGLADYYRMAWNRLQEEGEDAYYDIRDSFNQSGDPEQLLFLTRTCVNGLIRFNDDGEFNVSLHLSRPGIRPNKLARTLTKWSRRIQSVRFVNADYEETLRNCAPGDVVFLDPPYFNTETMYYGNFDADRFLRQLQQLNEAEVNYALTLDGASGETDYSVEIPEWAFEHKVTLDTGTSPYRKVVEGEAADVEQTLYLNYQPVERQSSIAEF